METLRVLGGLRQDRKYAYESVSLFLVVYTEHGCFLFNSPIDTT